MKPLPWYLTVFQDALYFTAFDHPASGFQNLFAHYNDVTSTWSQRPLQRPGATALFCMDANHRVTKLVGSNDFSLYVVSCSLWLGVQCLNDALATHTASTTRRRISSSSRTCSIT